MVLGSMGSVVKSPVSSTLPPEHPLPHYLFLPLQEALPSQGPLGHDQHVPPVGRGARVHHTQEAAHGPALPELPGVLAKPLTKGTLPLSHM